MLVKDVDVDAMDVVGLVFSYIVLFAYLVSAIRRWWQNGFKLFTPSMMSEHSRDASDSKKIDELTEKRHMNAARISIHYGSAVLAAALLFLSVVKCLNWSVTKVKSATLFLLAGHMPIIILALVSALISHCFKAQPAKNMRHVLHALLMAIMAWSMANYRSGQAMMFDRPYIFAGRLVGALVFGSFRVTLVLNVLQITVSLFIWSELVQGRDMDFLCGDWNCMQWFLIQEIVMTSLICILGATAEMRMRAEAAATIDAIFARNLHRCIAGLLQTIYDVVFELDQSLAFVDEATALSSLLLHGPGRSFKGASILDYMYDDAARLELQKYLDAHEGPDRAIPIRLQMRDSNGSAIRVELLHSTFNNGDSVHHLIGAHELENNQLAFDTNTAKPSEQVRQIGRVKRRTIACRGTPATANAEVLPEISDTLSETSSTNTLGGPRLQGFKETPIEMRTMSMWKLLHSWNTKASQAFCCDHHRLVFQARKTLTMLQKSGCSSEDRLPPSTAWQCPNCNLIDEPHTYDDSMICHWCEEESPLEDFREHKESL
eukprot:TRINITY_DN70037_c0_g1_i1.p1 TRINITY_DN70037_c0_g1~~TRINITY_DN70037_c0_g1_i1.p1  ORF type:complete len:545 (+),score=63.46 TRINITY_DN70037_c0_g1_i1:135-1769(+)